MKEIELLIYNDNKLKEELEMYKRECQELYKERTELYERLQHKVNSEIQSLKEEYVLLQNASDKYEERLEKDSQVLNDLTEWVDEMIRLSNVKPITIIMESVRNKIESLRRNYE